MSVQELKQLVSKGEGLTLEFKKKANHPHRIINEAVAFANTRGGYLLIGVDDEGHLSGIQFPEDDVQFIAYKLTTGIKPMLSFTSQVIPISKEKSILVFEINEGRKKPYYSSIPSTTNTRGTVFVRVHDESIRASYQMRQILRHSKRKRGQTIRYGDCEAFVLKIIDDKKEISLNALAKMNVYSKRQLSKCLVQLVLAGVIQIIPGAPHDLYKTNPLRDQ